VRECTGHVLPVDDVQFTGHALPVDDVERVKVLDMHYLWTMSSYWTCTTCGRC